VVIANCRRVSSLTNNRTEDRAINRRDRDRWRLLEKTSERRFTARDRLHCPASERGGLRFHWRLQQDNVRRNGATSARRRAVLISTTITRPSMRFVATTLMAEVEIGKRSRRAVVCCMDRLGAETAFDGGQRATWQDLEARQSIFALAARRARWLSSDVRASTARSGSGRRPS
jgi:hypothetical protein